MDVSVIIPTFNRAESLDQLLGALSAQEAGAAAFEVLVVDNGSHDATEDVVARRAAGDPRIRGLRESRAGASYARNTGIAAACAPILAFVDDDVSPRPDWLRSIVGAFADHPEVDCVGGRVAPLWPRTPPSWLTPAQWAPLALQLDRGRSQYIDREHASACLITANFACRAAVFRELGGFSPDYRRDEDREFNLRMWRGGKRGLYIDAAVVDAPIQPERLTKAYHRAWYRVTGESHARLRFRDSIDPDGRLDDSFAASLRTWWGAPAFLYRELGVHVARWLMKLATLRMDDAFVDECRMRYLVSYLATRWKSPKAG